MEEDADEAQEQGQGPPLPRVNPPSRLSERCSMIIKYAIRTPKQAGDYNKITNYLILHIRKTYENGRDIADGIENQEPFNFDSSAPKLNISTTVVTLDTSPAEKLEIKHENNQYRIKYKAELQLHLK